MPLPPKESLISRWKMDDQSQDGVVFDNIGGKHGEFHNSTTLDASSIGIIKNCLRFDGESNYITVPSDPTFNMTTFSYSVWLKHSTHVLSYDRILSKKQIFSDSDGYEIKIGSGASSLLYIYGSSDIPITSDLEIDWILEEWHHLVVVYNYKFVQVYIDGVSKSTSDLIAPVISNTSDLIIGADGAAGNFWNGYMDDIRYYRIPLTQEHVDSLYNNGAGIEDDGLNIPRPFPGLLII